MAKNGAPTKSDILNHIAKETGLSRKMQVRYWMPSVASSAKLQRWPIHPAGSDKLKVVRSPPPKSGSARIPLLAKK